MNIFDVIMFVDSPKEYLKNNTRRKQITDTRLELVTKLIYEYITRMRSYYLICDAKSKDYIEEGLSHIIYNGPSSFDLVWNGIISYDAIIEYICDDNIKKLSNDHIYPRKQSAKDLLNMDKSMVTVDKIKELYVNRIGIISLITRLENKTLWGITNKKNRVDDPDKLYDEAGIIRVKITNDERKAIFRRDMEVVGQILENINERIM